MPNGLTTSKPKPSELVGSLYSDYTDGMEILNREFTLLNDDSPLKYWSDGRKRFNSVFGAVDQGVNDWMSPYFSQMTRNKCLGIVAHTISKMIDTSIVAQNRAQEEDVLIAEFLKDVVEYTKRHENFDEKMFWAIVTSIAEGTVVLCDEFGPMGNLQGVKRRNGAFTTLVPNDEFLRYDPFIHDIQEQEWVMWRRKMTFGRFKRYYGDYDNVSQVVPGNSALWEVDFSDYRQYDGFADLAANEVEVVMRWKKEKDKTLLDIVANGVQLTKDGEESPRRDGQYPFAVGGFEPIDAHFFMFASLTKKLEQEQTETDHMWRTYINLQELKNKPPVRTNRPELVQEEIIVPGNVVFDGESSQARTEAILPQIGIDSGTVGLIQALMKNADDSSINPQQIGAPGPGVGTATESIQVAQNADVMLGLFGRQMSFLVRDWLRLRCQTVIWRLTEDEDMSKITIHDRVLKNGKTGKREYRMEPGLGEMLESARKGDPSMQMQTLEKSMSLRKEGEVQKGKMEAVLVDPQSLLDLEVYVYTDGEPKPRRTDAMAKAMALEDFNLYLTAPNVFNIRTAAEDLVRARGGDPDRLVIPEQSQPGVPQPGVPTPTGGQAPQGTQGPSSQMTGSLNKLMGQTAPIAQ